MSSRRQFLAAAGAVVMVGRATAVETRYPFTLGVASGSPRESSVVLWTRLAPDPLNGGGMGQTVAEVRYRLCADQAMRKVVREGVVTTSGDKAHSVHVIAQGLEPGREYWYDFRYGEASSPVGRTRTADRSATRTTVALASCNSFESGYFAAYADMARWAPDCVIHVGDYIYEGAAATLGLSTRVVGGTELSFETVRQHDGPETVTLWDYRNRYALYRSDLGLQAAHAASPWIVALDDHEIDNNWAGDAPQDPWAQTKTEFKVRKLAALRAYYEHMPIERPPILDGLDAHLQLYDAYRLGPVQIHLLDTRQYRSDQVCGQGFPGDESCAELTDPRLTMLGSTQERWLTKSLRESSAVYNVLASQTWFAPFRYNAPPAAPKVNMDQWDGYPLERQRIIDLLASGVRNPVVLSGDWHAAAAMRVYQDPWNIRSRRVGYNFCGTSISSHCPWAGAMRAALPDNPHVDHLNGERRGYLRCEIDSAGWRSDFMVVDNPSKADSMVRSERQLRLQDV
ncbi:MAG: alkaline phosphatase [Sinobacteraceae bacterium]|nr:alkaline phosphatase [Nevskiaceae bacterium]